MAGAFAGMLGFDLNLLNSLAALLQTRSVTEAARRMRVSQPAMSRALAELRRVLGDPLLIRTRGGMLLTRRAEELVEPLQNWLAEARRLASPFGVEPARLERRFRIYASDYGVASVIAPATAAIAAQAPGVTLEFAPPPANATAGLATGEADLLVSSTEPDRRLVHERHLFEEDYVCLVRAGHPLASTDRPILLTELAQWPQVVPTQGDDLDPFAEIFRAYGLDRRIMARLPYRAAARALLIESDAIAIVPAGAATDAGRDPRLAILAAPAEIGTCSHWLVWHGRSARDPATRWLIDLIAGLGGRGFDTPQDALLAAE